MAKRMNAIEKLIAELCPEGVEFKELGEITNSIKTGLNPRQNFRLNSTDANNFYVTVKEITTGKIRFSEKTDRINDDAVKIIQNRSNLATGDVLFSGIGTIGKVALVDIPTNNWNCSESVFVIKPKQKMVSSKFLMYILGSDVAKDQYQGQSVGSTLKGVRMATLSSILIPIPHIAIQQEIVKILDTFTTLEAELEAELEARKKQYEYYRDELLTFGEEVEWKSLGEVCDYVDYRGKTPKKTTEGIFLVTAKNIRKGYIDYETSQEFIVEADYDLVMRRGLPKIGDVLITTEAPCGFVAQVDRENIALAQRVIKYRSKNEHLSNSFLKHYLLGNQFQVKLGKTATGATVKGIKGSKLHKLKVPIPPLAEQKRIVAILDKFDALVNDISVGLPAELNARRKQYEYYRNKLLTFKPLEKEHANQ